MLDHAPDLKHLVNSKDAEIAVMTRAHDAVLTSAAVDAVDHDAELEIAADAELAARVADAAELNNTERAAIAHQRDAELASLVADAAALNNAERDELTLAVAASPATIRKVLIDKEFIDDGVRWKVCGVECVARYYDIDGGTSDDPEWSTVAEVDGWIKTTADRAEKVTKKRSTAEKHPGKRTKKRTMVTRSTSKKRARA